MLAEQPDKDKPRDSVRHVVNGDPQGGWYCYQCHFRTYDAGVAAEHDGTVAPPDYN